MSESSKYWIWLAQALGAGARVDEIFSVFRNPREIYESDSTERIISGVFTRRQIHRLEETKIAEAENIVNHCLHNGWQIVTPADRAYPAGLRKLADMPLVLYVDGDITCVRGKVMIGVVGTRKPCNESVSVARRISFGLASAGAVVVSGGALGIDSAAHEGAMNAGGKTVCVLGCGLGTDYLKDNEAMRRQIAKNGALVTEYPPFTPGSRATFPVRNRIISGMSHGVLVVEAGEKSGSLITAKRAVEQGREVFSIPGSVLTSAYSGANSLIRDGAKAVTCAADILESYAVMYPDRLNLDKTGKEPEEMICQPSKPVKKENPQGLDPETAAVYNLFGEEPLHPDEISAESGLNPSRVISALMQLEIMGLIKQTNGKNYILI
ncbi:MAG: DNA-processing protein DprA [Clostridia bacterium]|nr:DNA-processing protein DprA [Clostridia bacterium]